jgi:hypothetical protein
MAEPCRGAAVIKKIQWHSIPNTISGAAKKKLREVAVLDPTDLCFAVGEGSFAEDGREDIKLSATLAANIITAYKTDNRTDETVDAHFEADVRGEKGKRSRERKQGNPIVWGALSKAKVSILGTDAKPVFVVLGDGRQTAKTTAYVTDLLRRCREALNLPLFDGMVANSPEHLNRAKAAIESTDPVASKFSARVWGEIFKMSEKLGKPLASMTYSTVFWLAVDYTDDDPSNVRSLERSSMANFRVASSFSGEALKYQRMVQHYTYQDALSNPARSTASDEQDKAGLGPWPVEVYVKMAAQYVQNPAAVGGSAGPSAKYLHALLGFATLAPPIREAVDKVADPVEGLLAFYSAVRKYYRPKYVMQEKDGIKWLLRVNTLSEADQIAKRDKPKAERKPRAPKTTAPIDRVSVYKADAEAVQATTAPMSAQEQREVNTATAWLSWLSGDKGALDAFPGLRKAAGLGEPVSEAWREAYDLVTAWDGKAMFSFREPIPGDEADRQIVKDMIALVSDMRDAMPKLPELAKPADRIAWAIDWMSANKGAK